MEFVCNFIWERNGREQNEDALVLQQVTKEGKEYLLAVVCDGIGGLPEGENASSFVADSLGKELMRLLEQRRGLSMRSWRNAFLRKLYQCHQLLRAYGKEREIRLGTTLSMIFLCENKGYIFQAGDSVIFAGKRRLKRLSNVHRTKNGALKQAVGAGQNLKVEWKKVNIRKGSVILLASDGFYQRIEKQLTDQSVVKQLTKQGSEGEQDIKKWLQDKYRETKQEGERDNATAICVVCR